MELEHELEVSWRWKTEGNRLLFSQLLGWLGEGLSEPCSCEAVVARTDEDRSHQFCLLFITESRSSDGRVLWWLQPNSSSLGKRYTDTQLLPVTYLLPVATSGLTLANSLMPSITPKGSLALKPSWGYILKEVMCRIWGEMGWKTCNISLTSCWGSGGGAED